MSDMLKISRSVNNVKMCQRMSEISKMCQKMSNVSKKNQMCQKCHNYVINVKKCQKCQRCQTMCQTTDTADNDIQLGYVYIMRSKLYKNVLG